MIRVAGIKHLLAEQITRKDIAGLTPKEQFEAIQLMEHSQCRRQYKIYRDVKKRLSAEGIHIISFDEANEEEKLYLEKYVKEEIYPVVTPYRDSLKYRRKGVAIPSSFARTCWRLTVICFSRDI